ncbi:MAG: hypothetical protein ACRD3F_04075 [Acidobacteriaceae bacterium]
MTRFRSLVIQSLATVLIGSAALATNLQAQSDVITVSVPFRFAVGTTTIAPGTYQFSLPSSQFVLSVVNVKTGATKIFPVRPERQRGIEQRSRLVFRNAEGSNVLNEIHFPGTRVFSEVIQRRKARTMEAKKPSTDDSNSVAQR